eukprot:m.117490 g.117490  ORF g.117490 m.117490 type:complete len:866 (+) comp9518_c0_seq3:242-2839(+)
MAQDEGYVKYGTPVDIPEDGAAKKFVAPHDQVATDERGRRRFHGAFTGGFSAGYFNSVGSKEGWTPSTWVSSRSKQRDGDASDGQARRTQRPEDFMDEEDFGENGIAPRQVMATEPFRQARKRDLPVVEGGALDGAELPDLVVPASDGIGHRLLKMMGWREGQGIGPRQAARQSHANDGDATSADRRVDDFASALGFTFAPQDVTVAAAKAKDDFFGIGYKPLRASDYQLGREYKLSQGIGVGALEDDDEDIYAQEDRSQYDRETGPGMKPANTSRPVFRSARERQQRLAIEAAALPFDAAPIPGFRRASNTKLPRVIYKAPPLPPDFNPIHRFNEPGPAFTQHTTAGGPKLPGAQLSALHRSMILGETPIPRPPAPPPPKSSQPTAQPAFTVPEPPKSPPKIEKPNLSSREATMPGVFRPFQSNPQKEARYHAFLDGHYERPTFMSQTEQEHELKEFQGAARLYRPMASAMADRFASSSGQTDTPTDDQGNKMEMVDERDLAVKSRDFGRLTRSVHEWHPDRLLCRRFNVPDPYPRSGIVGLVAQRELPKFTMRKVAAPEKEDMSPAVTKMMEWTPEDSGPQKPVLVQSELEPLEPVAQRPDMDIFKAIFSDSDDDNDDDDDKDNVSMPLTHKKHASSVVPDVIGASDAPIPSNPRGEFVGTTLVDLNENLAVERATPSQGQHQARHDASPPSSAMPVDQSTDAADTTTTAPKVIPPARPAALPKLSLVHTHEDVRRKAQAVTAQADEEIWVERPKVASNERPALPSTAASRHYERKKDKKTHKSSHKSRKHKSSSKSSHKSHKHKHKSSSSRSRGYDAASSSSSGSDEEGNGSAREAWSSNDADMLARMRAVGSNALKSVMRK